MRFGELKKLRIAGKMGEPSPTRASGASCKGLDRGLHFVYLLPKSPKASEYLTLDYDKVRQRAFHQTAGGIVYLISSPRISFYTQPSKIDVLARAGPLGCGWCGIAVR